MKRPGFTITGPGVEQEFNGSSPAGGVLGAAQRLAMQAVPGSTLYVRDAEGEALYRVERTDTAALTYTLKGGER